MARDSFGNTLIVATQLCVVCSLIVAGSAVGLRSRQDANKLQDQKKNVLVAADLFEKGKNTLAEVGTIYDGAIEPELIDLESGQPVASETIDPKKYDSRKAAKDPELSKPIEPSTALGGIKQREKYAFVYKVQNDSGDLEQVVLPIYGKGLWSTLYGFIAVEKDGSTVKGITFYQHGETPGLGGEIDNPNWKKIWQGKQLFDDQGEILIEVVKGAVTEGTANENSQIDGLSGATITSNGVEQLVRYWIGSDGFGPYLDKLRDSEAGGSGG